MVPRAWFQVFGRGGGEPGLGSAVRPSGERSDRMSSLVNAMTVDVEDYVHVSAFAGRIDRDDWDRLESRVERNTDAVLAILDDYGVKATFFTLGWVAERYPALVSRIVAAGHELASHGFDHTRVHLQSRDGFRDDIRRTKNLLEDIAGTPVRGYRAASFSITEETTWAFDILSEEGHEYSSSVYPIRHDLYGMPEAPRFAFHPSKGRAILEVPITTTLLLNRNVPCGGGGYFRLLPYGLSRWAMRRVNRLEGEPCVFYFHPWEIDPGQPRISRVGLKSRIRHYTNLRRMESRLRRVLTDFAWDRMDRIFLPDKADAA